MARRTTLGRNDPPTTKIVPSGVNLFGDLMTELLGEWMDAQVAKAGGAVVHSGALAGEADAMGGDAARVAWNTEKDSKVCPDCIALNGTIMTMGEFLDIKYTTVCGGNCRCWPVAQ